MKHRPSAWMFGAVVALAAGDAAAARPDVRGLTCEQARALVETRGAVVITTGQYTYDRAVSNQSYCDRGELVETLLAPTRDNPRCRVGGYCRSRSPVTR